MDINDFLDFCQANGFDELDKWKINLVEDYINNQYVSVNKSRQIGFSTISSLFALYYGWRNPGSLTLHSGKLPAYLPANLKGLEYRSYDNMVLDNGSALKTFYVSPSTFVGVKIDLIIFDEIFYNSDFDLFVNLITNHPNARIIVAKTGSFAVKNNLLNWKYVSLPWYYSSNRSIEWAFENLTLLGADFRLDFECHSVPMT